MNGHLSIPAIEQRLQAVAKELADYCMAVDQDLFFHQPPGKWSAAQQVKHLVTATNTAKMALVLPKFIVRWVGGTPNRSSRRYDELVARYQSKLEQGGKARGRYIPAPVPAAYGKEKLLQEFTTAMHRFATAFRQRWQESQPDAFIVPHPLLGKITVRELCYFTIYHTLHHLHSIRTLTTTPVPAL